MDRMKPTRSIGSSLAGVAPHSPEARPGAFTAGVGINATPRRLRRAAVRADAIQRSPWTRPDFCLSAGLDPDATSQFERLLTRRARLRKGDVLFRVGAEFHALYAIRAGSCKTVLLASDGHDQVAGFHMAGEIIGMDGVGTDNHECQATALEDTDVCPLPSDQVENLARRSDRFRHNLHRLLSREGVRAQTLMIVLGTMRAEQRLAVFLLDLSQRYRARGYSPCEFVLRMTREEIGSYLGLKLETVSRLFSRFQRDGLLQVQGRTVKLLDPVAVRQLVDCSA
jgi:CRP/FNR family transcriptional regulator